MLDKAGITNIGLDKSIVCVCVECFRSLASKSNRPPKFALNNYLYRGHLPDEFKDLTWVEEMVCCYLSAQMQLLLVCIAHQMKETPGYFMAIHVHMK